MNRSDAQIRETAKVAAAQSEEFSNLAVKLQTSTLAIVIAVFVLVAGIISEFSLGFELFYPHYLDADGNATSDTFWRTASKTLILIAMIYPLEVLWGKLFEASGGDIPRARSTKQKFICTLFSVLHWLLFAVGVLLLFYVQANIGMASFEDLATYYQGEALPDMEINNTSFSDGETGNTKAAEHVAALWATLIVSGFAASLALFHLLRAVDRKKWVAELRLKKMRSDRLPQLLEHQASLEIAKDHIESEEYMRGMMFEVQNEYREEWLNGIRAARDFLHDARDPNMKIDFKDGEEYVGQRINIPERDVKLRLVNEAEKALKNLRLMSADVSGKLLTVGDEQKPEHSPAADTKVLDWTAIHNHKKGE